jgi:hypothetical protein
MFETMWRLQPRGAANRGICVDVSGAMLGPDWSLVERVAARYRVAPRDASRDVQKALLIDRDEPDWLYQQGQRIADAFNRGEIALAQIYGLRIPVSEFDGRQLKRLASIATLTKAGFNPGEPRIPAGEPGAGEWTTGGDTGAPSVGADPDAARTTALLFDREDRAQGHGGSGEAASDGRIVSVAYSVPAAPSTGGRTPDGHTLSEHDLEAQLT